MQNFTYQVAPMRVIFGAGTLLASELARLGISRALILATPNQAQQASDVAAMLGDCAAGIFAQAEMHTPVGVTERAVAYAKELGVDGVVAIGGGSTTGLGKAIALRTDLPQVVVPTSYAGSEMTSILGETRDGLKTTQSSPKVLPEMVIYDVDLTMTMPQSLSATSGLNAIAHAVEALYARDRNPIISLMAQEGIRSLARGAAKNQRRRRRRRSPHRSALWRLALRKLPWRGRDGASPQALPHARRRVQSAARRNPCRHPPARRRL
jgi:alcohol dehydrogenase class IV